MGVSLGVSCNYHDSAAALVVDGEIVAAVQEERFTRIRFDPSLPIHSMQWCLEFAGVAVRDVDTVVFYDNPYAHQERILRWMLKTWPRGWRTFPTAMRSQLSDKIWILDQIAKALKVDRRKVTHVEHHQSHAASAYYCSPFDKAAVLTVDGVGDSETTTIWVGDGSTLRKLESVKFPHSIGLVYAAITAWLGFKINDGEYKVMGLAAYGQPTYVDELSLVLKIGADSMPSVDVSYLGYLVDPARGYGEKLEKLLGPARDRRRHWDMSDPRDIAYANVARSLQEITEAAIVALARKARALASSDAMCMAGGVALNCCANALVSDAGPLFVQPAAGDAGGALGAALLGAQSLGDRMSSPLLTAALGPPVDVGYTCDVARELGFEVRPVDRNREATERMSRGEVIGWMQGRTEWGPRALGNRSILADPTIEGVRQRINVAVKQREPFRPFAPAVSVHRYGQFFDGRPDLLTPYMCTVRNVRSDANIDATTHIDGTSRVQTVSDGPLEQILEEVPVVLNTSLNAAGDPIAMSGIDGLAFLYSNPIDALIVEDVLITRPSR